MSLRAEGRLSAYKAPTPPWTDLPWLASGRLIHAVADGKSTLIGVMDTDRLAALVVEEHNRIIPPWKAA